MNKHHPEQSERRRKIRSDKGKRFLSNRDLKVLRWIAEQHGITLDHLHTLLSQDPGANAPYANFISMGAVRMEVARWLAAGWIEKEKSTMKGQTWIWPTSTCVAKLHLPFRAHALSEATRTHLYSVNTVRLALEEMMPHCRWIGERYLRLGLAHEKGYRLPHVPDAEYYLPDGTCVAIEVELTMKRRDELRDILVALVKGQADPDVEVDFKSMTKEEQTKWINEMFRKQGEEIKRRMNRRSADVRKEPEVTAIKVYPEAWYYAAPTVRPTLLSIRKSLLTSGILKQHEMEAIRVFSYPPVRQEHLA